MTGLVGWWRRVKKGGTKEGVDNEKTARLLEERVRKQDCKLVFILPTRRLARLTSYGGEGAYPYTRTCC